MLFGAVGIASLLISGFAAWLSWQFYKEARSQSDRVSESVNRIESVVNSVQAHIQQIVEKTITALLGSQAGADSGLSAADFDEKITEMSEQIEAILSKSGDADVDLIKGELATIVSQEVQKIEHRLREQRVRSLIPEVPKAVDCKVDLLSQDEESEEGIMTIEVLRPVPIATASGRFTSSFAAKPLLQVELVSAASDESALKINSGVSSGKRFNIHLNAANGSVVAQGTYQVKYRATVEKK
jgi:hypothetical protein